MMSYHNDPALKTEFVARMQAHLDADNIRQRETGYGGKGCAVWCTYDEYDHSFGPSRLGIPEWYEHLRDVVFEGLPQKAASDWALASLTEVPIGVDLEPVRWVIAIARHERQINRLKTNTEPNASQCIATLSQVIDYCKLMLTDCSQAAAEKSRLAVWLACCAVESATYGWGLQSGSTQEQLYLVASSALCTATYLPDLAESANSAIYSVLFAGSAETIQFAEYELERDTLIAALRAL